MEKEVEVKGVKYRIKALDPWIAVKFNLVSSLMNRVPRTPREADEIAEGVKSAMLATVNGCFTLKTDDPQTVCELFNELAVIYAETYVKASGEAQFFRGDKPGKEDSKAGGSLQGEAERVVGDERNVGS